MADDSWNETIQGQELSLVPFSLLTVFILQFENKSYFDVFSYRIMSKGIARFSQKFTLQIGF